MILIDIATVIDKKEHVNIEVKSAQGGIPKSVWETYSSFANTSGGVIILGIAEDAETKELVPQGVNNAHQLISDIWSTLNNNTKVNINILLDRHVYSLEYNGSEYVVIEVPRADRREKPVYVGQDMFKGSYRRDYEGDYHCSAEEVKAMLRDQADVPQDALLLNDISIDDLNQESIHRYRILFNNLKPNHIWTKLNDEEFLLKIGAAKKSQADKQIHPTLAGLLFFGDFITITDELPNYFLDYREHLANDTRWSDRVCSGDGNWSGNIFDFYYKVIDRLTSDVKKPFKLDSKMLRVDDTAIHKSLRECLANALIHADYYGRRGIVIDKEFRKITISNPGTFRISIDEAIAGGISDTRNSKIFNMFSLINVGERSGTGICDMYNVWNECGFKQPQIIETVNPDRVTLVLEINDANLDANDANLDANDANPDANEISIQKNVVYELIKNQPDITVEKLVKQVGVSRSTIQRIQKSLKDDGYIKREGSTRGKWIILK